MKKALVAICSLLSLSTNAAPKETSYLSQIKIKSGGHVMIKADKQVPKMKLGSVYVTITKDCQCSLESFDATMPQHKHGMFVTPSTPKVIESTDKDTTYKVEGVKLQMPGSWLLLVNIKKKSEKITVKLPYEVKI